MVESSSGVWGATFDGRIRESSMVNGRNERDGKGLAKVRRVPTLGDLRYLTSQRYPKFIGILNF